jgi:NADH dehydrogenase
MIAHRRGGTHKPFRYLDSGIMAMVGRNAAVAEVGRRRRVLLGPLAFIAWLSVHVFLLNTFWAKLQTLSGPPACAGTA